MSPSSFILDELTAVASAMIGGAKYGVKIRLPHAVVMTCLFRKDLSSKEKIRSIMKLVFEHSSNLAAFASIYKIVLATLKFSSRHIHSMDDRGKLMGRMLMTLIVDGPLSLTRTSGEAAVVGTDCNNSLSAAATTAIKAGQPERPYHSLLAGAAGGYFVWGKYSSVNHQIILYLTSRIAIGLVKRGWEHIYQKPSSSPTSIFQHPKTYPMVAATVWGIVMLLFEESPHVLHRSLKTSMDEIYRRPV
jgi:peroxisomal membrane protein 4